MGSSSLSKVVALAKIFHMVPPGYLATCCLQTIILSIKYFQLSTALANNN